MKKVTNVKEFNLTKPKMSTTKTTAEIKKKIETKENIKAKIPIISRKSTLGLKLTEKENLNKIEKTKPRMSVVQKVVKTIDKAPIINNGKEKKIVKENPLIKSKPVVKENKIRLERKLEAKFDEKKKIVKPEDKKDFEVTLKKDIRKEIEKEKPIQKEIRKEIEKENSFRKETENLELNDESTIIITKTKTQNNLPSPISVFKDHSIFNDKVEETFKKISEKNEKSYICITDSENENSLIVGNKTPISTTKVKKRINLNKLKSENDNLKNLLNEKDEKIKNMEDIISHKDKEIKSLNEKLNSFIL
jgi:hypothetical protein